jgi:hypothetical protein
MAEISQKEISSIEIASLSLEVIKSLNNGRSIKSFNDLGKVTKEDRFFLLNSLKELKYNAKNSYKSLLYWNKF